MPTILKNKNSVKSTQRSKWYTDKKVLRKPKQYRWSDSDRAILFHLRVEKKMTIVSIQRYFKKRDHLPINSSNDKYSTTRLYNQIRMAKAVMNGLCHRCRIKLTKKDLERYDKNKRGGRSSDLKLCLKCFKETQEYKDQRRQEAIDNGICPDCMKRKIIEGKSKCRRCLSWTQRSRNIQNLCSKCGKRPLSKKSITFCDHCLKINKKNSKEYRDSKKNGKR
jgi:hypothetical protein